VKPIDAYILWFSLQAMTAEEFSKDEPLSSPIVRGRVGVVAQKFGVDLDDAMGSKPESQMYVDCSPDQIPRVVELRAG